MRMSSRMRRRQPERGRARPREAPRPATNGWSRPAAMSGADPSLSRRSSLWTTGLAALLLLGGFGPRATMPSRAAEMESRKLPTRRRLLDVLYDLYRGLTERRLIAVAGGAAFFILLAIFPAVAAVVSVY